MESPGIARRIAQRWVSYGYELIHTFMVTGELSVIDGFLLSRRNYELISCQSSISLGDVEFLKYMDNFQNAAVSQVISFDPRIKLMNDPVAHLSQLALDHKVRADRKRDENEDDGVYMDPSLLNTKYYEVQFVIKAVYDRIEKRRSSSGHHQYTFQVYTDYRTLGDVRILVFEIAEAEDAVNTLRAGVLTWTEPEGLDVVCQEDFWQGLKQMSLF